MPKRKTKRRKKTQRASKPSPMPGWIWGVFGLIIGLSVAAAIYVKDREEQTIRPAVTGPQPAPESVTAPPANTVVEKPEPRFKFYDMLPNFEVVFPEEGTVVRNNSQPAPLDAPGIYVLQVGSFSSHADADRMKARLAMLGITSKIQKVSIEDKDYHRVRIGPVDSLDRLNTLRGQLRDASVDIMVIRVGD